VWAWARARGAYRLARPRSLQRGKTDLHPLGAGTGTGASASAGVLAEAVRRHQAEVAAFK
jgi:hypothetical protein